MRNASASSSSGPNSIASTPKYQMRGLRAIGASAARIDSSSARGGGGGKRQAASQMPYPATVVAPTANAIRQLMPAAATPISRSGPSRSPTAPNSDERDSCEAGASPARSTSATSVASHIADDAQPRTNDATRSTANECVTPKAASATAKPSAPADAMTRRLRKSASTAKTLPTIAPGAAATRTALACVYVSPRSARKDSNAPFGRKPANSSTSLAESSASKSPRAARGQ